MMFHGMRKNAQETEPTVTWNVSYVSHWIQTAGYRSTLIQTNIVNVTFDLKKGSFASIMRQKRMMFHGMWKNAQETEPTVLNYSYAGANTRNNNV